jgi:hypothetical protein
MIAHPVLAIVYPSLRTIAHLRCGIARWSLCGRSLRPDRTHACQTIGAGAAICPTCLDQAQRRGYACPVCGITNIGFVRGARCVRCAETEVAP